MISPNNVNLHRKHVTSEIDLNVYVNTTLTKNLLISVASMNQFFHILVHKRGGNGHVYINVPLVVFMATMLSDMSSNTLERKREDM